MKIETKFTIAAQGVPKMAVELTKDLAHEKFSQILDQKILESYIAEQFNAKYRISEMNSMSNQRLTVFVDDHIAGYAKITSRGKTPFCLENSRALPIADFAVLKRDPQEQIKKSLLDKCRSVCKRVEAVWINECIDNPVISFFESYGFRKQSEKVQHDELNLPSEYLVYQYK